MKFAQIALLVVAMAVSTEAINLKSQDDGPNWGKGGRPENDPDWVSKSNGGEGGENNAEWREDKADWRSDRPSREDYVDDNAGFKAAKMSWKDARPVRGE